MRCDVNVSVRPRGQEEFGTKVEIKNMNTFGGMQKAIDYEIDRQVRIAPAACHRADAQAHLSGAPALNWAVKGLPFKSMSEHQLLQPADNQLGLKRHGVDVHVCLHSSNSTA